MTDEHEWQRTTDHPSAGAVVSFLEADLERGLRLAWRAEIEWETERQTGPALAAELETVDTEICRWLGRAAVRGIATGHLRARVDQFQAALARVRQQSRGEGGGE